MRFEIYYDLKIFSSILSWSELLKSRRLILDPNASLSGYRTYLSLEPLVMMNSWFCGFSAQYPFSVRVCESAHGQLGEDISDDGQNDDWFDLCRVGKRRRRDTARRPTTTPRSAHSPLPKVWKHSPVLSDCSVFPTPI